PEPDAVLLFLRIHGDDTSHRRDRVGRVERRDDEVPGFRGLERRVHDAGILHVADEHHVGILAQRGAQAASVVVRVHADLALRDRGIEVPMEELDWTLERDVVALLTLVDLVYHCGHGPALARPGRTRD